MEVTGVRHHTMCVQSFALKMKGYNELVALLAEGDVKRVL